MDQAVCVDQLKQGQTVLVNAQALNAEISWMIVNESMLQFFFVQKHAGCCHTVSTVVWLLCKTQRQTGCVHLNLFQIFTTVDW